MHHTDIAGVIVRYEIRARNIAVRGLKEGEKENGGKGWRLEEVINFFRGVYLFGEALECICASFFVHMM